jgi:HAAS
VVGVSGERIEGYLDQLLLELRGRATDVRRVLAETEEHLRDATADGVTAGLSPDQAEAQAVARFGSPLAVARRFSSPGLRLPRPALAEMASALVLLFAVGLLAIGASGVLSVAFRATLGDRFVAADLPGATYTAARCRDFEEYHPEQPTCDRAAAAHHADEVETYRIGAGVLGAVVLAGWWLVRRRHRGEASGAWLPDEMVPLVGLILFGVAAAALGVQAANALALDPGNGGAGQWLSAAVVSLVVALAFGRQVLRALGVRSAAVAG